MKKIIALWGSADSGKSSSLKIVHKALSKLSGRTIEAFSVSGVDVRDIFIINGVKVGIETQGDPGSRLEESLDIFKNEGCKLIICATRTKGQTTELVNNLKPLYYISWRGQSSVSEDTLRDESNNAIASLILKEAKAVIYA
ncbi:MAG: hypothetical protein WC378_20465 [Opitutaceae bacterium]|jgi:hypothetical protein